MAYAAERGQAGVSPGADNRTDGQQAALQPQRWPSRLAVSHLLPTPHRPLHSCRLYAVRIGHLEGHQIIAGGKDAYLYVVIRIGGRQRTTPFATISTSAAAAAETGTVGVTRGALASRVPSSLPQLRSAATASARSGAGASVSVTVSARGNTAVFIGNSNGAAADFSVQQTFCTAAPNPTWPLQSSYNNFFYWDGRSAMPDVEFVVCARAATAVNTQRQAIQARAATLATLLEDTDEDGSQSTTSSSSRSSSEDSSNSNSTTSKDKSVAGSLGGAVTGATSRRPHPLRQTEEAVLPASKQERWRRREHQQQDSQGRVIPGLVDRHHNRHKSRKKSAAVNDEVDPVARQPVQPSSEDKVVGYARVRLDATMLVRASRQLVRPPKTNRGGAAAGTAVAGTSAVGSTSASTSKGRATGTTSAAAAAAGPTQLSSPEPPSLTTVQLGIRNEQDAALLRIFGTLGSLSFYLTAVPASSVQRRLDANGNVVGPAAGNGTLQQPQTPQSSEAFCSNDVSGTALTDAVAANDEEMVVRDLAGGQTTVEAYIDHQEEELRATLDRVTAHEALNRTLQRLLSTGDISGAPGAEMDLLQWDMEDNPATSLLGQKAPQLSPPSQQPPPQPRRQQSEGNASATRVPHSSVASPSILPWAPARGCTLVQATFHPLDPILDLHDVRSYLAAKKEKELVHAVRQLEILRRVRQLDSNLRAEWWAAMKRKMVRRYRETGAAELSHRGGVRTTMGKERAEKAAGDDDEGSVPLVTVDALLKRRGGRLRRLLFASYTAVALHVRTVSAVTGAPLREWASSAFTRSTRGVDPAQAVLWRLQQTRKWTFVQSLARWVLLQVAPTCEAAAAERFGAALVSGAGSGSCSLGTLTHATTPSSSASDESSSIDNDAESGSAATAAESGKSKEMMDFLNDGTAPDRASVSAASAGAPDVLAQTLRATHPEKSNPRSPKSASGAADGHRYGVPLPQAPADANGFLWEHLCIHLDEKDLLSLQVTVRVSLAPPPPLSSALSAQPLAALSSSLVHSPSLTPAPERPLTGAAEGGPSGAAAAIDNRSGGGGSNTADALDPGGATAATTTTADVALAAAVAADMAPLLLPRTSGETHDRGTMELFASASLPPPSTALPPTSVYAHYSTEELCVCPIAGAAIVQQLLLHQEERGRRALLLSPLRAGASTPVAPPGGEEEGTLVPLFFPCYAAASASVTASTPQWPSLGADGRGEGGAADGRMKTATSPHGELCGWLRVVLRLSSSFSLARLRALQQRYEQLLMQHQVASETTTRAAAASAGANALMMPFLTSAGVTKNAVMDSSLVPSLSPATHNPDNETMQAASGLVAAPTDPVPCASFTTATLAVAAAGGGDFPETPIDDDGEVAAPMPSEFVAGIPAPYTATHVAGSALQDGVLRGHAYTAGGATLTGAHANPALPNMAWAATAAAVSTASAAGTLTWSGPASRETAAATTHTSTTTHVNVPAKGVAQDVLLLSVPTAPLGGFVLRIDQVLFTPSFTAVHGSASGESARLVAGCRYDAVLSFPSSSQVRGAAAAARPLPPVLLFKARSSPAVRCAQSDATRANNDASSGRVSPVAPLQRGSGECHSSRQRSPPLRVGEASVKAGNGDDVGEVAAVWGDATYVLESCGPYLGLPLRVDIVEVPTTASQQALSGTKATEGGQRTKTAETPPGGADASSSLTASSSAPPRLIGSLILHYSTLPFVGHHRFPLVPPLAPSAMLMSEGTPQPASLDGAAKDDVYLTEAERRQCTLPGMHEGTQPTAATMAVTLAWSISPELQQQCLWARLRRLHRESAIQYAVTEEGVNWVFDCVRHCTAHSSTTAQVSGNSLPERLNGSGDTDGTGGEAQKRELARDATTASAAATLLLMRANAGDAGSLPLLHTIPATSPLPPHPLAEGKNVKPNDPSMRRAEAPSPPLRAAVIHKNTNDAHATATPLSATSPRMPVPQLTTLKQAPTLGGTGTAAPPRNTACYQQPDTPTAPTSVNGYLEEHQKQWEERESYTNRMPGLASPLPPAHAVAPRRPHPTPPPLPLPRAVTLVSRGSFGGTGQSAWGEDECGYHQANSPPVHPADDSVARSYVVRRHHSRAQRIAHRNGGAAFFASRLRVTVLSLQNLQLPSSLRTAVRVGASPPLSPQAAGLTLTPYVVVRYQESSKDNHSFSLPAVHVAGSTGSVDDSGGSCGRVGGGTHGGTLVYFTAEFEVPSALQSQPCHLVTIEVRDALSRQVFGLAHVLVHLPSAAAPLATAERENPGLQGSSWRGRQRKRDKDDGGDELYRECSDADQKPSARAEKSSNRADGGVPLDTVCAPPRVVGQTVTHVVPVCRRACGGEVDPRPLHSPSACDDAAAIAQQHLLLPSAATPACTLLDAVAPVVGEVTVLTTWVPRPSLERHLATHPVYVYLTVLGARGLQCCKGEFCGFRCSGAVQSNIHAHRGMQISQDNTDAGWPFRGSESPDAYVLVTVRRCEELYTPTAEDSSEGVSSSSSGSDEVGEYARSRYDGVWSTREYRSLTIAHHRNPLWYLELPPIPCCCPADVYTFTVYQADNDGFDICLGECSLTAGELLQRWRGRSEGAGGDSATSCAQHLSATPQSLQLPLGPRTGNIEGVEGSNGSVNADGDINMATDMGDSPRGYLLLEWSFTTARQASCGDAQFSPWASSSGQMASVGRRGVRLPRGLCAAAAFSAAIVVEVQLEAATALALELAAATAFTRLRHRGSLVDHGSSAGGPFSVASLPVVVAAVSVAGNEGFNGGGGGGNERVSTIPGSPTVNYGCSRMSLPLGCESAAVSSSSPYTLIKGTLLLHTAVLYHRRRREDSHGNPVIASDEGSHQDRYHSGNAAAVRDFVSMNAQFPSSVVIPLALRTPPPPVHVELWLHYPDNTSSGAGSAATPVFASSEETCETAAALTAKDAFVGETTIHAAALTPCTSPLQEPTVFTTLLRPRRDPRYRTADVARANQFATGLGTLSFRAGVYPVNVYEARQRHRAQQRGWRAQLMVVVQEATDFEADGVYAVEVRCVGSGESRRTRVLRDHNPRFHETFAMTLHAATEVVEVRLLEWPSELMWRSSCRGRRHGDVGGEGKEGEGERSEPRVVAVAYFTVEANEGAAERGRVIGFPGGFDGGASSCTTTSSPTSPPLVHATWLTLQPTADALAIASARAGAVSHAGMAPKLLLRWRVRVCAFERKVVHPKGNAKEEEGSIASDSKGLSDTLSVPSPLNPSPPSQLLCGLCQPSLNRLQGTRQRAPRRGMPRTDDPPYGQSNSSHVRGVREESFTVREEVQQLPVLAGGDEPEQSQWEVLFPVPREYVSKVGTQKLRQHPVFSSVASADPAQLQQPFVLNVMWCTGELVSFLGTGGSTARDVIAFCAARCRRVAQRDGQALASEEEEEALGLRALLRGNAGNGDEGDEDFGGNAGGYSARSTVHWLPPDEPLIRLLQNGDYVQVGCRSATKDAMETDLHRHGERQGIEGVDAGTPTTDVATAADEATCVAEWRRYQRAAPQLSRQQCYEEAAGHAVRCAESDASGTRTVAAALSRAPLHMSKAHASPVQQLRELSWLTGRRTLAQSNTDVVRRFASYAKADLMKTRDCAAVAVNTEEGATEGQIDVVPSSASSHALGASSRKAPADSFSHAHPSAPSRPRIRGVIVTFLYAAVTEAVVQQLVQWVQAHGESLSGFCRPVVTAVPHAFHVMERVFGGEEGGHSGDGSGTATAVAAIQPSDSTVSTNPTTPASTTTTTTAANDVPVLTLVDAAEVYVQGTAGVLYAMLCFLSRCCLPQGTPALMCTPVVTMTNRDGLCRAEKTHALPPGSLPTHAPAPQSLPFDTNRHNSTYAASSPLSSLPGWLAVVEEVVGYVPALPRNSFQLAVNTWEARQVWIRVAQKYAAGSQGHEPTHVGEAPHRSQAAVMNDVDGASGGQALFYVLPWPAATAASGQRHGGVTPGFFFADLREGHGGC
jgi:hypothetical protein